jgi:magnesium-transporting ATPase (P-type)
MTVAQQINDAATEIGPLLAVIALFSAALSANLQAEKTRAGGSHRGAKPRIAALSLAMAFVSIVSFISLTSLAHSALKAHGTSSWEPAFWVFLLVYVLLIPLCVWQIITALVAIFGKARCT